MANLLLSGNHFNLVDADHDDGEDLLQNKCEERKTLESLQLELE